MWLNIQEETGDCPRASTGEGQLGNGELCIKGRMRKIPNGVLEHTVRQKERRVFHHRADDGGWETLRENT